MKLRGGMEFRVGRPIRLPPPPESVQAHPLRLRSPERPEVVVGQVVRRGDHLIKPIRTSVAGYVSPVTGTVRSVTPASTPWGGSIPVKGYDVTIEPSGPTATTWLDVAPPRGRKLDNWFATLRELGPWADRDGTVGLIAQLDAARTSAVDTVICVGLDAFPPYPDRSSLLMSYPDDAVLGTLVLADLLGAPNVSMIAAKSAQVLGRLRPSCRNYRLNLIAQPNLYPSADPTLVVAMHVPGKRRLPHGSNPVSQGVVIITPWTAIRIGRWHTLRKFDLVRPIIIGWPDPESPLSARYALPGQPLSTLDPRLAERERPGNWRFIVGNPMTGRPAAAANAEGEPIEPVVPDDETVVAVLSDVYEPRPEPCISCGWCVEVCPTRLRPVHLMQLCNSRADDEHLIEHLSWCIDCGLCSHVCPSALPLAQTLRGASQRFESA